MAACPTSDALMLGSWPQKVRIKSLQRREMLADEKWELMKNQLRDVMIQMKEIHEELREIRGHKTEQATAVTTTTRVTGSSIN